MLRRVRGGGLDDASHFSGHDSGPDAGHRVEREVDSRAEQGMATAELAVALPSLVALVLAATGLVAAAETALRCEDAARIGARSVARGDPASTSDAVTRREAPRGAVVGRTELSAGLGGGLVRVTVSDRVRLPGPLGALLPEWTVRGTATALREGDP